MTDLDLRAGKLEQSCPDCGRWEAAGAYCSGCGRSMGPGDWYGNGDETRRAVAHERAAEIDSLRVKRPRGRPRADASTTPLNAPSGRSTLTEFLPVRGGTSLDRPLGSSRGESVGSGDRRE